MSDGEAVFLDEAQSPSDEIIAAMPVCDVETMLHSLDNDAHLAQALAQLFVAGRPRLLARVRAALAAADTGDLGRAAHVRKGALGVAAALETAAANGDLARAAQIVPRLEAEVRQLLPVLESLRDGAAR